MTSRKENFVNQLEGKIKQRLASEAKPYLHSIEQATELARKLAGEGAEKEAGAWCPAYFSTMAAFCHELNQHKVLRG